MLRAYRFVVLIHAFPILQGIVEQEIWGAEYSVHTGITELGRKRKKVCGFPGRAASRSHSRSCHDGTPSIDSAKGRLSMHQGRRHPLSLNFAPMPRDTNGTPDARLPTTIEKKKCRKERGGYFSSRLDHTRRPLSRRAYVLLLHYMVLPHGTQRTYFFLG